jgi:hypothetical protein
MGPRSEDGLIRLAAHDAACVHVNTIRKMEAKGDDEITSAADVLRRAQSALEKLGVEFANGAVPA